MYTKRVCTYVCSVFMHTCMYTHVHSLQPAKSYWRTTQIISYQEIPTGHEGNKHSSHLECYYFFFWAELFPTFRKVTVPSFLGLRSPGKMDVLKWNYRPLSHSLQVWKFMQEVAVVMQQHFGAKAQIGIWGKSNICTEECAGFHAKRLLQ
jgi:hypothetical protein